MKHLPLFFLVLMFSAFAHADDAKWTLKSVVRLGDDAGVEVTLAKGDAPAAGAEDKRETQVLAWTRDADQAVQKFAVMVKGEIDARLAELNAPPKREDVTAIYQNFLPDN